MQLTSLLIRCATFAGQPPSAFLQDGPHLDYGRNNILDCDLNTVVAGLLQPMVNNRMRTQQALKLLGKEPAGKPVRKCAAVRP